jgi:hypothetical protein
MWLSYGEERAMANDLKAQERADATPDIDTPVLSPGYVRCPAGMHPGHDDAVVFTPGQLLPEWVAEALAEQKPEPSYDGIYVLSLPKKVESHGQTAEQDHKRSR